MEDGTCRQCMRRRPVYRLQRLGGGTFRRGGRWYWSSICQECAGLLLSYANETQRTANHFSVRDLKRAVADA